MKPKICLALALLVLALVFILQNTEVVSLRLLFWQLSLSRALLLFLVFASGLTVGLLFGSLAHRQRRPWP